MTTKKDRTEKGVIDLITSAVPVLLSLRKGYFFLLPSTPLPNPLLFSNILRIINNIILNKNALIKYIY